MCKKFNNFPCHHHYFDTIPCRHGYNPKCLLLFVFYSLFALSRVARISLSFIIRCTQKKIMQRCYFETFPRHIHEQSKNANYFHPTRIYLSVFLYKNFKHTPRKFYLFIYLVFWGASMTTTRLKSHSSKIK